MIVSTTLAGPGAEASIVDALRSCAHLVEYHQILLSGCDREAVKAAITASYYDGLRKVVWRDYAWPDSYGEARTEALRWAERLGATWALTVDCDERVDIDSAALHAALQVPGFDVLCMVDRDLGYQKPRLIRCGSGAVWKGACHERLEAPGKRGLIGKHFWELPKSPEAERRRMERGIIEMPKALEQEDLPQLRRHYGECLIGVGRQEEGFEQLRMVLQHPLATQFERSWCEYRLCELDVLNERFEAARDRAALALGRDPGFIQEFCWILAHCAAKCRNFHDAALWANYALGAPVDQTRAGHRSPTWRAGCEDLLAGIERAARAAAPQEMTAEHFEARAEFAGDYELLARSLVSTLSFSSHLDLGAGNGLLVGAMRAIDVFSLGIETSAEAEASAPMNARGHVAFGQPLETWGHGSIRFDLVSCVEVAEHIPADRADELVDACALRARRWVYWSAAAPGQGGIGHVNEQPQGYWIEKFRARGWVVDQESTRYLIDKLAACKRCWWLQRNALIFKPL